MSCDSHVIIMTIIATRLLETVRHGIYTKVRSETLAAVLCLRLVQLEQIKFNRASVISAGQSKKVFLWSSGVRHRIPFVIIN